MNKEQKSIIKHSFATLFICVIGSTLVFMGSSYALLTSPVTMDSSIINVGSLQISYDQDKNRSGDVITLNSSYPSSDATGLSGKSYEFSLSNISEDTKSYTIQVVNDDAMINVEGCSDKLLPLSILRYSVNGGLPVTLGDLSDAKYTISSGDLKAGESMNYQIRLWVMEGVDDEIVLSQHYHGRLVVTENTGNNNL